MTGTVGILNVGAGDITLSFDKANPSECIRASRIVKDMLRRGYALLVEVAPGQYRRAHDFDESIQSYIIADYDPSAEQQEISGGKESASEAAAESTAPAAPKAKRRKAIKKALPAASVRAVAVGRTAGG
jgi:hypothetical protein